ncbi:MAG: FAD-dependent oxidoreductase, partial [Hungatella sp.]
EREKDLGGQLALACIPPYKQEISRWLIYLRNELSRLAVTVLCGTDATKELLDTDSPDVVVVATGAREIIPPIPGVSVETAITAQMLLKNETVILGGNILVIGGGMVGCEVCELLTHQKRGDLQLTMIEMLPAIGSGMVPNNLLPMMKRLQADGVRMLPGTKLVSVDDGNATVACNGETRQLTGFTNLIFACGSRESNELYTQIKDSYPHVICIGDANSPRQALEAVREGWEAAAQLSL